MPCFTLPHSSLVPVSRAPSTFRPQALAVHLLAGGLAVFAPALQAAEEGGSLTLPSIAIDETAPPKPSAITEGTNSYTSRAARTATPLSLSPRETPQSVSVITRQRIDDQDLQTILDVVNNATGVSVNRYETSRGQFNARGFVLNSLMIDGVPTLYEQPWSSGEIFSSLAMYDRVEVVRGANGLMTGAGDPSASLNLVRKRAYSSSLMGSLEVSAGRWDAYGLEADVATALNGEGTVRARLVGETTDTDTWIDMNATRRQTLYGTMDVDLTPSTTLWFGLSRQETEADSPMWGGLPVWYADGSRTDWSRSKTTSARWSQWDTSHETYFVNLDHTFANDWQLNLSYNRGERKGDSYLLYLSGRPGRNGSAPMYSFPGSYDTETTQDDYSIRLSGPFSLLGREHEVAVGYVYSKQEFDAASRNALTGMGGVANFDAYDGDFPAPVWAAKTFYGSSETTQEGLYAATRLNLTDALKVILGARQSGYEKTGIEVGSDPSKIDVDHELTPYAGLVYDLTPNLSAYASYTEIFLPQAERDIRGQQLDPVVGESAEMGLKGEYFDGRLNASATVFRIKQDNLGENTGVLIDPSNPLAGFAYEEGEGATSEGFEVEVSGELATNWNATAGYTQFTLEDADGEDVNTVYPTKLLRLFTTYRLPGALNKLTIGGGVNWQNSIYTYAVNPAGNPEKIEQDAYALVNVMARYDVTDNLSAQLNVNNLTDEKYFDLFTAFDAVTYGAPRNVTVSAKYRF